LDHFLKFVSHAYDDPERRLFSASLGVTACPKLCHS